MNYEEAVAYIEETPKFTTKNKLSHTKECLGRLGNPEKSLKSFMWQEPTEKEVPVLF